MKKLSVVSRILVAFATGALVTVFFLPAWRIDLFAPQYPEGLTMNIWVNGLSGDVEVINGLNHYIGMKHITKEMFPEFTFLPYVVGFYMLLGMIVAISGRTRFLLVYLVLTLIGGALAMWDFYKWGYDYGHNLDPTAPIQVPGFSYQPPLIGHKRLLNFDAYSFPDVGGWIVIGAGMLAFGVWFVEWYRHRASRRMALKKSFTLALPVIILSFVFSSSSAQPVAFRYGQDHCDFCKMGITDTKFGGEIITGNDQVYKFDDLVCMARFMKKTAGESVQFKKLLVVNYQEKNEFLQAEKALYVVAPGIRSPMGSNAGAFAGKEAVAQWKPGQAGVTYTWQELLNKLQL